MLGFDLRNASALSDATLAALKHPGILAISQDPRGEQATLAPPPSPPSPQPAPTPAPPKQLCLGSLGVYGTDPQHLTHLVPCNQSGPPVASRWSYDSSTKQVRYEGVRGQPKPKADICLAAPKMATPMSRLQLNTTACATGGQGWEFQADGVLSVPNPQNVNLSLCINVWRCDPKREVVFFPCKPLGVGTCGSVNEKWALGSDGEEDLALPG